MNGDCLYTLISLGLLAFIIAVMQREEDKRITDIQNRRLAALAAEEKS